MTEVQRDAADGVASEGPYYPLRIRDVVRETHDACSILLDVPERLAETFRYKAGQFLTFRVTVDGKRLVRCYSLASSPDTDPVHKVTVKRVERGRVSNHVNDVWRAGDELEVMHPTGVFCLEDRASVGDASRPILLFGGGSGITPIISIIKTALATTKRPLRLLYANRDERSIIFRAELGALAAAHPDRLAVEHSLDAVQGFVDAERATRFVGADAGADFYICGPGPFMDVAEGALRALGVPDERIFIERFESSDYEPIEEESEASPDEGVPVTVVLDGVATEITCLPGETILHAARRAGLEPPFACEEAYCGCCMAHVKEGDVDMKTNDGGIDQSQIDQGWVLTCQGVPKTPGCKVEYPD